MPVQLSLSTSINAALAPLETIPVVVKNNTNKSYVVATHAPGQSESITLAPEEVNVLKIYLKSGGTYISAAELGARGPHDLRATLSRRGPGLFLRLGGQLEGTYGTFSDQTIDETRPNYIKIKRA